MNAKLLGVLFIAYMFTIYTACMIGLKVDEKSLDVHNAIMDIPSPKKEPIKPVKVKRVIVAPHKTVKPLVSPKETKLDINRLAHAVAMAETGNCKDGYGKAYNNCFGIKDGNTAPCERVGKNKMCIYKSKEESYKAFKKIWGTWYKTVPTEKQADTWTGGDRAKTWRVNVLYHYNKNV